MDPRTRKNYTVHVDVNSLKTWKRRTLSACTASYHSKIIAQKISPATIATPRPSDFIATDRHITIETQDERALKRRTYAAKNRNMAK